MKNNLSFLKMSLLKFILLFFIFINDLSGLENKTIDVCVLADEEFQSFKNWVRLIHKRFKKVNHFYIQNFGIQFNIKEIKTIQSNNTILSINEMFVDMKANTLCSHSEIVVIYIGQIVKGSGISSTLSNKLMVVENNLSISQDSSLILAHELAHLFGAWHNKKKGYLMNDSGFAGFDLDPGTKAIIKFMKNRDFKKHGADLSENVIKKINILFERYKTIDEINPIARVYVDRAVYLTKNGKIKNAIQILLKAKKLAGRWSFPRILLAENYFANKEYDKAYTEYNLARFFGAKKNEKLEKYFSKY